MKMSAYLDVDIFLPVLLLLAWLHVSISSSLTMLVAVLHLQHPTQPTSSINFPGKKKVHGGGGDITQYKESVFCFCFGQQIFYFLQYKLIYIRLQYNYLPAIRAFLVQFTLITLPPVVFVLTCHLLMSNKSAQLMSIKEP